MKYVVVEIQQNANGTVGCIATAYAERELAEQKYHTVLSAAAVSNVPVHACSLLAGEGYTIKSEYFEHIPEPEPNEEEPTA